MQYQADECAAQAAAAPARRAPRAADAGVTRGLLSSVRLRDCARDSSCAQGHSLKMFKIQRYKTNAVFHSMTAPIAAGGRRDGRDLGRGVGERLAAVGDRDERRERCALVERPKVAFCEYGSDGGAALRARVRAQQPATA